MKIVVTGATGFVGRPLTGALLGAGHTVSALSRDAARARATLGPQVNCVTWGKTASGDWKQAVGEADVVVHLAGESVDEQKWTPEYKAQLRASRVETTRALVEAIGQAARKPEAFIGASAVGFYGDRKDETVTEEAPPGTGFLAELCQEWEAEAVKAEAFGVRVARMRAGIVLGDGGALKRILYPFPIPISPWKLGGGGPLGNGRQWMPWIHLDDAVGMYLWAATNTQVRGPVNATSPNPVTNAEFTRALGRALHRPAFVPVPSFLLRALVGEFSSALLTGQKAIPQVALNRGFPFRYPALDAALQSILRK